MLYIRLASRLLFIRTYDIPKMEKFYTEMLDGVSLPFEEAFDHGNEHCTLIFLTAPDLEKTRVEDAQAIIFFPHGSSVALSEIFNHNLSHLVEKSQLGPGSIVMRVPKEGEKLIATIKDTYNAQQMDLSSAITLGEKDDTILVLTNQSLYQPMKMAYTVSHPLLIHKPISHLYDELRKNGLLYITNELEDHQWCELKINIYDSYGEYKTHYNRLIHVLSSLDLGMVLGESWTRDHALSLFSVLAYQVRLFTLHPPLAIKAILKGLEYDDAGNRLVDFDLYYKNKKISAAQLKTHTDARLKEEKGIYFRQKLLEQLSHPSIEYLHSLEKSGDGYK